MKFDPDLALCEIESERFERRAADLAERLTKQGCDLRRVRILDAQRARRLRAAAARRRDEGGAA